MSDELKANPHGRGKVHDFGCTHDPCRCRVGRCDSIEGGIRCRGLKGHKPPHWGARNPGDSLIGVKYIYGIRLTPQARAIFWAERNV